MDPAPLIVADPPDELPPEPALLGELEFELLEPQAATPPARTTAMPTALMRRTFAVFSFDLPGSLERIRPAGVIRL